MTIEQYENAPVGTIFIVNDERYMKVLLNNSRFSTDYIIDLKTGIAHHWSQYLYESRTAK